MKTKMKMKSILTDEIVEVHPSIEHADCLYHKLAVWVDEENNSYGQCRFGIPLGFELLEFTSAAGITGSRRSPSRGKKREQKRKAAREKGNEL
jgi:hypothetical protein